MKQKLFIQLQPNEEDAHADCGCYLARDNDNGDPAIYLCPKHTAAAELLEALQGLTNAIDLSKLNIRKDFSLINNHAYALKVIRTTLSAAEGE